MKTLTPDTRKGTGHRLAIVEGHLKKVRRMVDEGAGCVEIVHQSRAIQQALKKFDGQILEQHLRTCVARDINGGNAEKATKEILSVFDQY